MNKACIRQVTSFQTSFPSKLVSYYPYGFLEPWICAILCQPQCINANTCLHPVSPMRVVTGWKPLGKLRSMTGPWKVDRCQNHWMYVHTVYIRVDSRFATSQWEMALLCNDVSHWLVANLESAIRADSRFATSQWETSLQSNAVSHWLDANLESTLYIYLSELNCLMPKGLGIESIFMHFMDWVDWN